MSDNIQAGFSANTIRIRNDLRMRAGRALRERDLAKAAECLAELEQLEAFDPYFRSLIPQKGRR